MSGKNKDRQYVKISIRRDTYEKLKEFARSRNITISDAVAILLEYATLGSMIQELHTTGSMDKGTHTTAGSIVSTLRHTTSSMDKKSHTTTGSMRQQRLGVNKRLF